MAITKVTNSLVATNAIQGTLIADNAITSVHIAQNQVTSVQIPDSSITSTQLAANSVDTAELISGSIDAIHLASDSVTTAKILNANITTAKIANNAITSALIPDGSITDTQLGSGAFTMGNITTTGSIRGPASFTIDPAAVGDNTGTVVIAGSLQVDGTTTTINSTTLSVADKKIELASGAADAAAANDSGITVTGANATLRYLSSGDKWSTNKDLEVNSKVNTNTINNIGNTANIIYRSSTNTIVGNSSSALVVQDGGNIGMGTTSPKVLSGQRSLTINASVPRIDFKVGDAFKHAILAEAEYLSISADPDNNQANSRILFAVDSATRMTLDSSGDVTIADGDLYLGGGTGQTFIEIAAGTTNAKTWRIYNGISWNPDALLIYNHTNDATALTIEPGKLGVGRGASSLTQNFEVSGTGLFTGIVGINKAVNGSVGLSVGSDASSATSYGLEICNSSSNTRFLVDGLGSQRFYGSDNSETARFTNGKLGIGETEPQTKLHVKTGDSGGTVYNTTYNGLVLESSTHGGLQILTPNNRNGLIYFGDNNSAVSGRIEYEHANDAMLFVTGGAERMRINSRGALVFTPSTGVEVNNSIVAHTNNYMYMFGNTSGLILQNNTAGDTRIRIEDGNTMRFETSSTERMRIDAIGNIRMGNALPTVLGPDTTTTGMHFQADHQRFTLGTYQNLTQQVFNVDGEMAATAGSSVTDAKASKGTAFALSSGQLFGPYTNIKQGTYRMSVRVRCNDASSAANAMRMSVYTASMTRVTQRFVSCAEFETADEYQTFSIDFDVKASMGNNLELYVFPQNSKVLTIDYVTITNHHESYSPKHRGIVTAPNQPDFLARRSGNGGSYNPYTYSQSIPYNAVIHDHGSNFDTSTGLFTAPVAGTYLFQGSIYSTSTSSGGWVQAWLTINGARGNYTDIAGNGMDTPSIISTTHMVTLAIGDTVGYHPYGANATFGVYENVHHTWFKGRLLG